MTAQPAPEPQAAPPVVPGYAMADLVGEGGSGRVWAATSLATGGAVAVKVLPPESVVDESAARELATLTGVGGEHIMSVHEAVHLDDGSLAIVMDLMTGGSLDSLVRHRGHLSPGEAVTVLSPIASAVAALHRDGVVHGDVSPGNVLLDRSGRPRLSDLGTARVRGEVLDEVRGTSGFVAPEVLLGADPTAASDVYGVGALGWLCLTGRAASPGPVRGALADQVAHLGAEAEPLVAALSEALWADPERRPTAAGLAVAVFDAADAETIELTRPGDDVSVVTRRIRAAAREGGEVEARPRRGGRASLRARGRHTGGGSRRGGRDRQPRRSSGRPVGLVGIAAIPAVVLAGAWWLGRPEPAASAAGAAPARTTASASTPSAAAGVTPAAAATAPVAAASGGDLRLDPRAAAADPRGLVQALADARARAWATGVAARLSEVDAPHSAAMRQDVEALAAVQRAGRRYVGLRFTVAAASVERMTLQRTTIRTRVDSSAYAVVGRTTRAARPAARGDEVLLDLVWTEAGWRVTQVRAA